jgi:hypothetical protein
LATNLKEWEIILEEWEIILEEWKDIGKNGMKYFNEHILQDLEASFIYHQ